MARKREAREQNNVRKDSKDSKEVRRGMKGIENAEKQLMQGAFFSLLRMWAGNEILSVTMTKGHRLRRLNAQNEHLIK